MVKIDSTAKSTHRRLHTRARTHAYTTSARDVSALQQLTPRTFPPLPHEPQALEILSPHRQHLFVSTSGPDWVVSCLSRRLHRPVSYNRSWSSPADSEQWVESSLCASVRRACHVLFTQQNLPVFFEDRFSDFIAKPSLMKNKDFSPPFTFFHAFQNCSQWHVCVSSQNSGVFSRRP